MNKHRNYKELNEILARENTPETQLSQIAEDIINGDKLLDEFAAVKVPDDVINRLEKTFHDNLNNRNTLRFPWGKLTRIAALLTILLAGTWAILRNESSPEPVDTQTVSVAPVINNENIENNDMNIWELALLDVDETETAVDDYALEELLILMGDDFEQPIETIFG